MTLKQKCAKFKSDYTAAHAEMMDKAAAAFKEFMADFFTANPDVKSVGWDQYQMYWNDGDPTSFSVYADSDSVRVNGVSEYGDEDTDDDLILAEPRRAELAEQVSALLSTFDAVAMEVMFGDHAAVILYSDGRQVVEECSHE